MALEHSVLLAVLVAAVPAWLFLQLMDRLRRWAYGSQREVPRSSRPRPNPFQAMVTLAHSLAFLLAAPIVCSVLVAVATLPFWFWPDAASTLSKAGRVACWLVLVWAIGLALEFAYRRAVRRLMAAGAGMRAKDARAADGHQNGVVPPLHTVDGSKPFEGSPAGAALLDTARSYQRRLLLRDTGAVIVAGLVAVTVGWLVLNRDGDPDPRVWALCFAGTWLALMMVGRLLEGNRMAARFPFRQLRLGFSALLAAPLTALSALWGVFSLSEGAADPEPQWTAIKAPTRWVDSLLSSGFLLWIPIALVLPSLIGVLLGSRNPWLPLISLCTLAAMLGFRILVAKSMADGPPHWSPLVFLRVFGDARRGRFLFEKLVPRYRGLGTVTCISAPDVAVHQIGADHAMDALFGQVSHRFPSDSERLWSRAFTIVRGPNWFDDKAAGDQQVGELHCFSDTWKTAVDHLFGSANNVIALMDLRGFTDRNRGCIYEIGVLRDRAPIGAAVYLVDDSTDIAALTAVFQEAWSHRGPHSENEDTAGSLRLFQLHRGNRAEAQRLVAMLCESLVAAQAAYLIRGRRSLASAVDALRVMAMSGEEQINLLGPDAPAQIRKLGLNRLDCDDTGMFQSSGAIDERQGRALSDVTFCLQDMCVDDSLFTVESLRESPSWEELRVAARGALGALREDSG